MKKRAALVLAITSSLALSGCLGDVMELFCDSAPMMMAGDGEGDADHCYQTAAVQEADPEDCAKIQFPPPRSKCHLMIAENTGNPAVCTDVDGGMMGYSQAECLAAAFKNHSVEDCTNAEDEMKCRTAWAKNGKSCGDGYVLNRASGACEEKKEEREPTENPLEVDAVKEDLGTMADIGKSKYMEYLDWDIEHETDPDRLEGLQKYKEFLENAGETLEDVQAKFEKLQELKKIFIDSYDPKDAIENMSARDILAKGFFDRLSEKLIGADPPTEASKAEDALTVYEKMLERQQDNDYLQQGRLGRLSETLVGKTRDEATSKLKEGAEDIAKTIAGDAFAVVGIVDHALSSFQAEAQKQMFVGLAAAYNRQRDAITQSNPNLSPEEIHKRTVANVKANPYEDLTNLGFVKFGNIIENGDCKDAGNNPLCIDNRVFWVAMDKTYKVTHKK